MIISEEVIAQAKKEFQEEVFRESVEEQKIKLREKRLPWWKRLLNKKIVIKLENRNGN